MSQTGAFQRGLSLDRAIVALYHRPFHMRLLPLALTLLMGVSGSAPSRAQPAPSAPAADDGDAAVRSRARALGYAGVQAYEAGNFREASDLLEEAFRLLPVPSLGLWSARALDKLGKLVEADARYLGTTRLPVSQDDPPVQRASREEAERERASLLTRIPTLSIQVKGADPGTVSVSVDGVPLAAGALHAPRGLNPGEHHVVARRGTDHAEGRATLREREHQELELVFIPNVASVPVQGGAREAATPSAALPDAPQEHSTAAWRTAAWWTAGAGAAGLVLGGVTYGLGRARYNSFKRDGICPNDSRCNDQGELERYEMLRMLSGVSLAAGAVLVAAGVTVLVVTPVPGDDVAESAIEVRVSAGGAEVVGSF